MFPISVEKSIYFKKAIEACRNLWKGDDSSSHAGMLLKRLIEKGGLSIEEVEKAARESLEKAT